MSSLNLGSVINSHYSFGGERHQIKPGLQSFRAIGVAIIDPKRPSRDVPFIIPSRQKGIEDKAFQLPIGTYITRVGLRIPAAINLASATYEVGAVLGAATNVQAVYVNPGAQTKFDYSVCWALADFEDFGRKRTEAQVDNPVGSGIQSVTEVASASGALVAEAAILSDPTVANGDSLSAIWEPHWLTPNAAAAPTTYTNKKLPIILDVSGYYIDANVVGYETATAGMQYLLD